MIGSGSFAQESTAEPTFPATASPAFTETVTPLISTPVNQSEPFPSTPTQVITETLVQPEATDEVIPTFEATPFAEVTEAAEQAETPVPSTPTVPSGTNRDGSDLGSDTDSSEGNTPQVTQDAVIVDPQLTQTYCQMNIGNGGDTNPFTYTFSATSANIVSWSWDFGDGNNSSGQSVNHTFAGPGTYTILLTCAPDAGFGTPFVLTGTVQVSLPAPVAQFTINEGTMFQQVVNIVNPLTVSTHNISTPTSGLDYAWTVTGPSVDCGGAMPITTENVSCTFLDYGTYTFSLVATNTSGTSSFVQTVSVQAPPPIVDFTMTPTNAGEAPLTVTFAAMLDAASGPVTSWEWDFNGDTTVDATVQNPGDYTYNTPGLYNARLRVVGPGGTMQITRGVNVFATGNSVQAAFTMVQTGAGSTPGTVQVCFTNTSTGPIVDYGWDFGDDSTTDDTTSEPYFCRDFAPGLLRVRLNVSSSGSGAGSTSDAYRELNLVAAPVAAFTYTPSSGLTQATQIDFNSGSSTGIITSYAWDFDGDGVTDSTAANPQDIQLAIGSNRVRLTVTGPGGSSSVEQIIQVDRLEITCSINGTFTLLPDQLTQTYTAAINNAMGRPITYTWSITGGATPATGSSASFGPITFPGDGIYQITLNAATDDGSLCSDTRTVTVTYPPLVCNTTNPLPNPLYANGQNYTFTAQVSGDAGRTLGYQWYVDGVLQGGTGTSFTWTNPAPSTGNHTIRYVATASDGSTCYEEVAATITPYSPVTCTSISGNGSPIPVNGSGVSQNIQYTANLTNMVGGRTADYTWTVQGATSATPTNPTNVQWPLSYASNGTGTSSSVDVSIVVHTPGLPDETITCTTRTVNVRINDLVCNAPTGDLTPVYEETNTYNYSINNLYGRTPSLSWVLYDSSNAVVDTGTGSSFSYQFLTPGETYRLEYTASVSTPQADSCTASANLVVSGQTEQFACDAFPTGGNNFSPATPGNYTYTVDIDNGNGILLHYDYVLVGPNGGERIIGSYQSNGNGLVTGPSPAFTLNDLGPIGIYTLRVDVRAVNQAITDYTCSLSRPLTVGSLNVSFAYDNGSGGSVNNSAVEVGTPVCFTNTSAPVPPTPSDQNALTYTWDVDGTANDTLPGCLTFDTPGTYTVNLTGVNDFQGDASFRREGTASVTFTVYGKQSITITKSNEVYAPATMSFSANGTNITGGYNWTFYQGATVLGTRTNQQNPTFNFLNPGTYRAVVVGTGPLGTTTAEVEFTLIGTNDILASFIPSQYAGIAPMTVCFTDTSQGQNLTSWEWDFGNGETLSYTDSSIPSQICTTYPTPDTSYPVTLLVTNQNGTEANATNIVRTYSLLESSATFTITPQGTGYYCFTPQVTGGVVVTGWQFGDGSTGTPANPICHQYQSVGDFRVIMEIEGPDGTPGSVERVVTVSLSSSTPSLAASAVCSPDRTATFTITNNGAAMTTADQAVVRNANGDVIDIRPVLLGSGGQLEFSLPNQSGQLTLTLTDNPAVTVTTTCNYPPELSVSATCANGLPVFTITNARPDDGPMAGPQAYEIRDAENNVIASGTFELTLGEATETITLPVDTAPYAAYTLVTNGAAGSFSLTSSCDAPVITISATCSNGLPVFTLTNTTPDTPMAVPQAYEIRDAENNVIASGTFELTLGEASEMVTLPAGADPYEAYTFVTNGAAGSYSLTSSCDAPVISVSATCSNGLPVFTLTNTTPDAPMAGPQAYEIRDTGGNVVSSGTFELGSGVNTATITLPSGAVAYAGYTFVSDGASGTFNLAHRCDEPVFESPARVATVTVCANSDLTFRITNTTGSAINDQPYTIVGANGVVAQGTLTIAVGETQAVTLLAANNPGGSLSLNVDVTGLTVDVESACGEPVLVVSGICGAPMSFSVTNRGGAMTAAQSYTLTSAGASVTLTSGSFQLGAGETTRISVPASANRSTGVTLRIDGETPVTSTLRCGAPVSLSPTETPDVFRFTGLSLVANAPVCAAGCPTYQLYHTDETGDWEIFRLDSYDTLERTNVRENLSLGEGEGVVDLAPSLSPDTNWIVFQSNRDGNWELYVAPTSGGNPDAVQRLTYNTVAIDSDPMWGPNNFVVFESTRNGNYDLYLIDMSTGQEYRLTDDEGDDINPYWSPDGTRVIFQSDRGAEGRWQLFELNVITGALRELSDNTAIEVDPQYSHDGSQIVFRSYANEGDPSTLMIMNANGTNRRVISDVNGDATNAAWSPSDSLIAYQSDLDGDLDVYIYDVGTGETRQLTDNAIDDYAPTWRCGDDRVVFTSDIEGEPNIYQADATPISDPSILVEEAADQMTFEPANDVYPQNNPSEENASREGRTLLGSFGEQTVFLQPPANVTPIDLSRDGLIRDDWNAIRACG